MCNGHLRACKVQSGVDVKMKSRVLGLFGASSRDNNFTHGYNSLEYTHLSSLSSFPPLIVSMSALYNNGFCPFGLFRDFFSFFPISVYIHSRPTSYE